MEIISPSSMEIIPSRVNEVFTDDLNARASYSNLEKLQAIVFARNLLFSGTPVDERKTHSEN